jgi:predicted permease
VLTVAVATAFALAALMTLVPGWLAARAMTLPSNRTVARATSRSAHVMLVLQIAATLVLVFGSTLLARSLFTLETTYRGYRGEGIVSARLTQTAGGYADLDQAAYYPQLADRLASLPGVTSVGFARYFGTMPNERSLYTPVHWAGDEHQLTTAIYEYTMPGFFSTLSVPLLHGRDFTWGDAPAAAPVAIVSESLARALADDGHVVGRQIRFGSDPARQNIQIVGVVGDISFGNPRVRNIRAVFLPGVQAGQATYTTVHLKVAGDRAAVADGLRQTLASMGREQIVVVSSPDGLFINGLSAEWLGTTVGSVVAVLALCMACVGVYALLAYAVARRTREIGIRLAIGAGPRDVWMLVTREALALAAAGAALGIPGALAGSKLIDALVHGVSSRDPGTLALSATLLLAIAGLAAAVPAMRAIRVDPMVALRTDAE